MGKQLIIPNDISDHISHDPLTGLLVWHNPTTNKIKVGDVAGWICSTGYLRITFKGKKYLVHRVIWFLHYGEQPPELVDHKNCLKVDNRIKNLRSATPLTNMMNKSKYKNNTSGITGVGWVIERSKWMAHIRVNGRLIKLGYFKNKRKAATVRKAAEKKYFKKFRHIKESV